MKNIILSIIVISYLLFGCAQEQPVDNNTGDLIGGDTDEHGCLIAAGYSWCEAKEKCLREWEEPCEIRPEGALFNYEQAYAYVQSGWDCTREGNITEEYVYNEVTHTWWFEMDIEKEGCSPACVVYEDTVEIELNWRCTGLIEPDE